MSMPNRFKDALASRRMQIGIVAGLSDPYCTDILGGAPFDWILIDGEHSPCDTRSVLGQLQVLAAHQRAVAFRSGMLSAAAVTQWLDIGVQTLVAPMVESAAQATALVTATRYPPNGRRGVGPALSRSAAWGRHADHLSRANEDVCVVAQIESPAGVDNVEAIADAGVDAILVGPSDLAAAMGYPGNAGHRAVKETVDGIVRRTLARGKPVGTFVADAAAARRYAELGCTFLIVGVDTRILAKALDDTAATFRSVLQTSPSS
jgi:4-hydroxy-2-oxoheptanedioate aldolase